MIKSPSILLSSASHLPLRSTWQATVVSISRMKGPRALGAVMSLMLAGVLSVYTCMRANWDKATARAAEPRVLLLTYSHS